MSKPSFILFKVNSVALTGERILTYLKQQAWSHGANGIINVQKDYKLRKLTYSSVGTTKHEQFDADVFRGLAVNIQFDSNFIAKNDMKSDTSFLMFVKKDMQLRNEQAIQNEKVKSRTIAVAFVIGTAGVIISHNIK